MRLLHLTHKHTVFIFFAIACLLLTLGLTTQKSQSATGTNCGPDFTVLGGSTSELLGVVNLKLAVPSSTLPISKVIFRANGKPIGKAQPTNNNYTWAMPWDTSLHPIGSVALDAEVYFDGQTSYCAATGYTSIVSGNQPASSLVLLADPQGWEGPKSYGFPVHAFLQSTNATIDLNMYALYSWQTSIGALTDIYNNDAQFSTGNTEGSGQITVRATYGGKTAVANIPISVKSLTSPLPEPNEDNGGTQTTSNTSTDGSSDDTTATTSGNTTTQATLQNNPVAQNCVVAAIGQERYDAINSGKARPTTEEIQKFKACFASSNYILPYNFAPVEPTKVRELKRTDAVRVEKPSNTTIRNEDDTEKDALVFSGTAAPNSTVIIYVFSNPLVLTTTANANGEWTYTLEDPIEPGDHEVYTVVDRGDGVYERSDPIAFSIVGTAEAAGIESNPSGLSLRLSDQVTPTKSKRSLIIYALASIGTIVVVGVVVLLSLRIRHKKTDSRVPTASGQPTVTSNDQSASAEQPTTQTAEQNTTPVETVTPVEPTTIEPSAAIQTSSEEIKPETITPTAIEVPAETPTVDNEATPSDDTSELEATPPAEEIEDTPVAGPTPTPPAEEPVAEPSQEEESSDPGTTTEETPKDTQNT